MHSLHCLEDSCAAGATVFDEVAFPLARGPAVKELSFAIGLSQTGICWGAGKAPTVHTIVLFAVPLPMEQSYLSLVLTFASFSRDKMAFSALRQCAQPEEMLNVLTRVRCDHLDNTRRMLAM